MWCSVKICVLLLLKAIQVLSVSHPLDPLTSEEIHTTVQVIKLSRPPIAQSGRWVYNLITLKEPEKSPLLPYFLNDVEPPHNSKEIPRRSLTILRERERNVVNEVIVNLHTKKVESWKGTKLRTETGYTLEETERAIEVAKNDTHVQKRCRRLGWENPEKEDFPILATKQSGFILQPFNFFLENPSLDVPPTPPSSQQRPPPSPPSALASEAPPCKDTKTKTLPYFKL